MIPPASSNTSGTTLSTLGSGSKVISRNTLSFSQWSNGSQIPASFASTAFGASGPFYQSMPANPQIDPNSASMVSYYFSGNPGFAAGWIDGNQAQAQYDYTFPVYTAALSDPLVSIVCSGCPDNGQQIHIPARAQQAGGNGNLVVLQPNGLEYDFANVASNPPYTNGSQLKAGQERAFSLSGSNTGSAYIAPGFEKGAATASGIALSISQIYTSELAAGSINHAIALTLPCGTNATVFPASQVSGTCANGAGMPLGSLLWWALSDTQTSAMAVPTDIKTMLIAMHHYGAFFSDTGSKSMNVNGQGAGASARLENQESYWTYGNGVDPAQNYAASAPGWNHIVTSSGVNRYRLAVLANSIDFLSNLKVIAPCVVQQTCPTNTWTNGQQIPASYPNNAFGASGPFYQQLPSSPQIDPNSASAIGYYFNGNTVRNLAWVDGNSSQAQYDYSFPVYTASNSDPLVTIACTGGASCADSGAQIHLPALAQQAGGSDAHLAVLQPNGVEYDFWSVSSQPPYINNAKISASGEAHFTANGSGDIASGFVTGAATAGGIALSIGQTYTSELAAGVINHAISLTFPCGTSAWVYPSSQTTGICGQGQGMPLGSRVWWALSDAQTQAIQTSRDMQTILIALHHYGGFFTDGGSGGASVNGGGVGLGLHLENQEAYWIYGNGVDPVLNHAVSAGWNHIVTSSGVNRYVIGTSGGAINFLSNLQVLAPCVTQGAC
jgi:hypothetical protein